MYTCAKRAMYSSLSNYLNGSGQTSKSTQTQRNSESSSFVKLLRHAKVLALASDPDFKAAMEKMEFEKALDYALEKPKPKASADPAELPREALVTPPPPRTP